MSRLIPLIAATAILTASATANQPSLDLTDETRNAALVYWRAWALESDDLEKAISEDFEPKDPQWTPGPACVQALVANQDLVDRLLRAARSPTCDFQIAYEQGFAALLPHLGKMRQSAKVLIADSRRLTAAGDLEAAARRIAAVFAMADHVSSDGIIISSLVSMAICSLGEQEIANWSERGVLTDQTRSIVGAMLDRMNRDDPFRLKLALEVESRLASAWIRQVASGPDAGSRFVDTFKEVGNITDEMAEDMEAFRSMTEAQFAEAADWYQDVLQPRVLAAWDAPDASERLAALETSIKEDHSDYKAVTVAAVMPSYQTLYTRWKEQTGKLAETRRLLGE